jgi:hypothetical protein
LGSAHPTLASNSDGQEIQLGNSFVSDTAIWHDRVREDSILQNVGEAGISISQIGISQIGSKEISPFQISDISQIGISQIGISQISLIQNGISQLGIGQIDLAEIGLRKINTNQDSVSQDSSSQITFSNFGTSQIGTGQIYHSQIGSVEPSSSQIDTRQVQSGKIANIVQIIETGKIPLPSSITLQQFLSSHNFNLQNTTIPTWTEFLTGTTPFNLNIEILDLPTGQLAEANITRFDSNGRPTSGTLTLDTDANGLGWFIDSTPWDNAEFGTLNAETFFRATLGSAAYGHYDLLTTILHELGHLAGLISGNPTYDSRVQTINGTPTFQGNGYSTPLTQDRSHLADPTKLMSTYLAPGMRKLPSHLELQMLADLRSTPTNSNIRLATRISARQDATPMLGITNGQFDQLLTQWDTRGSIQVTNAAVTLTDAYLDQSPDADDRANAFRLACPRTITIALPIAEHCRQKSPCPTTV